MTKSDAAAACAASGTSADAVASAEAVVTAVTRARTSSRRIPRVSAAGLRHLLWTERVTPGTAAARGHDTWCLRGSR